MATIQNTAATAIANAGTQPTNQVAAVPQEFIELLRALARAPSVTGAEHAFFRVLQRELEERGATVTWYEGMLVAAGGLPGSVMFSAHVDRHGLVCTGPGEFQYAAFVAGGRSDLLGNSVSEELLNTVADRFHGDEVFAYEPWSGAYLGAGRIAHSTICDHRAQLLFTVSGLDHVVAGTPVAFRDGLVLTDTHLAAQLDNVLSAAALVHLFAQGFQGTAFFTAEEECGKSWRYLLEWFRRFGGATDRLFVIDTSPYASRDEADAQQIVLRRRDANAPFHADTTDEVANLVSELGYEADFKDARIEAANALREARGEKLRSLGSTELGRIIAASDGAVTGTTLQFPTSGYHTMHETVHRRSVAACLSVIESLAGVAGR